MINRQKKVFKIILKSIIILDFNPLARYCILKLIQGIPMKKDHDSIEYGNKKNEDPMGKPFFKGKYDS